VLRTLKKNEKENERKILASDYINALLRTALKKKEKNSRRTTQMLWLAPHSKNKNNESEREKEKKI
jgi:hypothetical protein